MLSIAVLSSPSATLFAKSKNPMLAHLYADVIEEKGGGGAKAGVKKKGGSMQTISASHRVRLLLVSLNEWI
jgi:hypothetical protein